MEYDWRQIKKADKEEVEHLLDDIALPLNIPQKRMIARLQQIVYLPMPNFYACRLRPPGNFQKGSYRTDTRSSGGKQYSIVMGRLKGQATMTEQSYRYSKDAWEAAAARSHCERHEGNFEA